MSKTKNTPEFLKMMEEQELSASFHYQEQEAERELLFNELAQEDTPVDDAVTQLSNLFNHFNVDISNKEK